ncbi:MAG: hypothetical protein EOO67_12275, partial [Microbacterium sp.]
MVKFFMRAGSDVEPMPDWDVYACDSFGRPSHLIGGVMGAARTREDALAIFLTMNPEIPGRFVWVG